MSVRTTRFVTASPSPRNVSSLEDKARHLPNRLPTRTIQSWRSSMWLLATVIFALAEALPLAAATNSDRGAGTSAGNAFQPLPPTAEHARIEGALQSETRSIGSIAGDTSATTAALGTLSAIENRQFRTLDEIDQWLKAHSGRLDAPEPQSLPPIIIAPSVSAPSVLLDAEDQITPETPVLDHYPDAHIGATVAIVTVPDPRVPRLLRRYEEAVTAIDEAMIRNGYVLDRYSFPWRKELERRLDPWNPSRPSPPEGGNGSADLASVEDDSRYGVLIYRKDDWRNPPPPSVSLRVLYVVPETGTYGVQTGALYCALRRIAKDVSGSSVDGEPAAGSRAHGIGPGGLRARAVRDARTVMAVRPRNDAAGSGGAAARVGSQSAQTEPVDSDDTYCHFEARTSGSKHSSGQRIAEAANSTRRTLDTAPAPGLPPLERIADDDHKAACVVWASGRSACTRRKAAVRLRGFCGAADPSAGSGTLEIIGPEFSGSVDSIRETLQAGRRDAVLKTIRQICVLSPAATADSNALWTQAMPDGLPTHQTDDAARAEPAAAKKGYPSETGEGNMVLPPYYHALSASDTSRLEALSQWLTTRGQWLSTPVGKTRTPVVLLYEDTVFGHEVCPDDRSSWSAQHMRHTAPHAAVLCNAARRIAFPVGLADVRYGVLSEQAQKQQESKEARKEGRMHLR